MESVIQKCLMSTFSLFVPSLSGLGGEGVKFRQEFRGNTGCVTYILISAAPAFCNACVCVCGTYHW